MTTMYSTTVKKAPFPFLKLSEIGICEATTWLVYGPSKSGKTFFAGTAGSRTLYVYFAAGEGIVTLKSPAFTSLYSSYNPIICKIAEQDTLAAYDAVCDTVDYAIANMRGDFDTIILDEATSFRRHAMWKGLQYSKDEGRSHTFAKAKIRDRPFFTPTVQDYGMEMQLIEWWVATYTELCKKEGIHLLVLAHQRETFVKKDPTKTMSEEVLAKVRPGFTGKTFPDDVTMYFDNVFRLERIQGVSRLHTTGDDIYLSGTRYGGVFKEIEPQFPAKEGGGPNFLNMLKKIQESGIKPGEFQPKGEK